MLYYFYKKRFKMKNILFLAIITGLLFADDFKFNPKIDNIDKLSGFCWKSYSCKGINFGYNNMATSRELCDKYLNESIEYYKSNCDKNDSVSCQNLGKIYGFGGLGSIKEDKEKSLEFYEKSCELKNAVSCEIAATNYNVKFRSQKDKKIANEYKNKAIKYYKQACELGYSRGCEMQKRI